ncbi:retrovirus-related pol polyprotein from transposon TNT 1-94 [Tanacetum coccineum]
MGTTRTYTLGASGSNSRKQRTVIYYNCKGEGHMSKQCTKPKRKLDDTWFKDKVLLVQVLANGQILHEEELAFLVDPGIAEDVLDVVHNPDNMDNNMLNQEKESLMKTVTLLKIDFKKEESRNIDREITLEKNIKHLDNIIYKRDQSAQTVHMLTKPQFFYDHTTKQALGFQNPFYLKKAQQLEPKLYDGNIIKSTNAIVIPDSEETLMLTEESQFYEFFRPSPSCRPTKVEVPKELPKVIMVNTSLKKLKHHLAGFDVLVKERTMTTAITEGSWGFEHTKACFRDEIIPFVKALKDIFNTFDQYIIDELTEVQNVFHQMEQAVEQHRLESKTVKVKMNQVLNENEQLLEQVINKDIVNIIMNSSMDNDYEIKKYKLEEPKSFHYLSQSNCYQLVGINEARDYLATRRAMGVVGISDQDQEAIFRLVAAILRLGNVEYIKGKEVGSSLLKDEKSKFHLKMTTELLMCDRAALEDPLLKREMVTPEEVIKRILNPEVETISRDSLAKTLYCDLFDSYSIVRHEFLGIMRSRYKEDMKQEQSTYNLLHRPVPLLLAAGALLQ